MKITQTVQDLVTDGLRRENKSKKELAAVLGVNPGWVTKFFDGTLKTLTDRYVEVIEKFLNIKFQRIILGANVPGSAIELGKLMNERPELVGIVNGLLAMAEERTIRSIPYMHPKELIKIGGEITRIVAAWDQAEDPHYAKIALESIKIISEVMNKKAKTEGRRKK